MGFNKHESGRQRAENFARRNIAGPNHEGWKILDQERQLKSKDQKSRKDKRSWKRIRQTTPQKQIEQINEIVVESSTMDEQQLIVAVPTKPKKSIPFDAEDSWNYRERMDKREIGSPAMWGEYEGLIEIYRERRVDDMRFGMGIQKNRRVKTTRGTEPQQQQIPVTEQLPDK